MHAHAKQHQTSVRSIFFVPVRHMRLAESSFSGHDDFAKEANVYLIIEYKLTDENEKKNFN